jgi:two-component system response regulator CpxR
LANLVGEAGHVVRKDDLSEAVLERKLSPYDRSLDMHISNLRKKLGSRPDGSDRIKTIRSVGYIYTIV